MNCGLLTGLRLSSAQSHRLRLAVYRSIEYGCRFETPFRYRHFYATPRKSLANLGNNQMRRSIWMCLRTTPFYNIALTSATGNLVKTSPRLQTSVSSCFMAIQQDSNSDEKIFPTTQHNPQGCATIRRTPPQYAGLRYSRSSSSQTDSAAPESCEAGRILVDPTSS